MRKRRRNEILRSKRQRDWETNNSHLFKNRIMTSFSSLFGRVYKSGEKALSIHSENNKDITITEFFIDGGTSDLTMMFILEKLFKRVNQVLTMTLKEKRYTVRPYILRSFRYMDNGHIGIYTAYIHDSDINIDHIFDEGFDRWTGSNLMARGKLPLISYESNVLYTGTTDMDIGPYIDHILTKMYDNDKLYIERDKYLGLSILQPTNTSPARYVRKLKYSKAR